MAPVIDPKMPAMGPATVMALANCDANPGLGPRPLMAYDCPVISVGPVGLEENGTCTTAMSASDAHFKGQPNDGRAGAGPTAARRRAPPAATWA